MVYKRTKQRQEVDYGQKLRQQRVDGAVSTYFGYSLIPRKISRNIFELLFYAYTAYSKDGIKIKTLNDSRIRFIEALFNINTTLKK